MHQKDDYQAAVAKSCAVACANLCVTPVFASACRAATTTAALASAVSDLLRCHQLLEADGACNNECGACGAPSEAASLPPSATAPLDVRETAEAETAAAEPGSERAARVVAARRVGARGRAPGAEIIGTLSMS